MKFVPKESEPNVRTKNGEREVWKCKMEVSWDRLCEGKCLIRTVSSACQIIQSLTDIAFFIFPVLEKVNDFFRADGGVAGVKCVRACVCVCV